MTFSHAFSRALRRLHVFASSSDWLIGLSASVVIGRVIILVLVLRHSIENRSIIVSKKNRFIQAGYPIQLKGHTYITSEI